MDAIKEGIKEVLRTAVIAAVPVAIDGLQRGNLNLRLVWIAAAIAGLRGIDKWLHKSDIPVQGLVGF